MTKFEADFRGALEDRGIINPDWRVKIISREIIGNSDCATICFVTYPPKKRNPYCGSVKVNFVRSAIYWDTYSVSSDRRRCFRAL